MSPNFEKFEEAKLCCFGLVHPYRHRQAYGWGVGTHYFTSTIHYIFLFAQYLKTIFSWHDLYDILQPLFVGLCFRSES